MSNLFEEALGGAQNMEEKFLGPSYEYYKQIKLPSEIGMSSDGNLSALGKDVDGLVQYVELLVTGGGNASATGKPLGNKFFLLTGQKCNDIATSQQVDRYIYIDNVPEGNVPFISSGMGVNFSEFKGLIPGTISNLNVLSPYPMMQSFLAGAVPDCQAITMQTVDVNNNASSETQFVTTADIGNMDPCIFPNHSNPVSGTSCREAFESKKKKPLGYEATPSIPNDLFVQLYFAGLGLLGIYILFKMMVMQRRG